MRLPAGCKNRVVIICLLWLLPAAAICQAPDFKFKRITTEQGLSHSDVDAIYQGQRGFIWLGTRYGLDRYDGVKMTVYYNDPTDSTTISNNTIRSITEDHNHQLWVGTRYGLNRFNSNTNTFVRYLNVVANAKSISSNAITCVFEDSNKNLWVSTGTKGLNLFNFKSGTFSHFRHQNNNPNSISTDSVNCIFQDKKGKLWVGTQNGLNLFDPVAKTFKKFNNLNDKMNIQGANNFTIIKEDDSGNLWLGTKDSGVSRFNIANKVFESFNHNDLQPSSLGSDVVRAIIQDKSNRIWIGCSNGGLNLFDPKTNSFFHYQNDPENSSSLSQTTITSLFQDNQSNLWVGTHRGGVNLYAPHANLFNLYQEKSNANTISYSDVKTFCQDHKGNIWVGTDGGGMNLFNKSQNTFKRYTYDPKNPRSISSNAVMDIYEDHHNNIWVSTFGGGLNLFDPGNGTFTHFKHDKHDPNSISSNFGQKSFEDSQGNLWIGTYYAGLNLLDGKTRKFKRVIKDPDGVTSISGNNIVTINEDNAGNVWFGTDDGGLNAYNLKTKRFSHYFNKETTSPDVRVIFNDSKGRLWVGQLGLYLFDTKENKFNLYTTKANLSNEFIKGITQDKFGKLWISTNKGITRFNPENQSFKKFNIYDGLQGLEYEPNAYMQTRDGEMFFGGTQGLNTFYPEKIKNNRFIPPVYITNLEIFNKTAIPGNEGSPLTNDISVTKRISLSHAQSSISFDFAALNYVTSENNQYAYKLEGFDKDWVPADNTRKASYTNLDPGTYTFRVKASNNDGVWNEEGASVTIDVKPPFWLTWWFIGLTILLVIGSAYAYYRNRINAIKRQREQLERQVKERTAEVELKAEELQSANAELNQQSEELSKQAAELKLLNAEIQKQKEQELEKAIAQGKFEIASEVLHDIGNALVGFGAHLNRINRSLDKNNIDTIKNLAVFLKGQQTAIAGVLGEDKANALVTITEGISKTQGDNQVEINASISELFNIITHIQEILNIQRQFVRGHGGGHQRKPVNLVNIIDDCRSMLFASFDKHKIDFKVHAQPGSYVIKGDHTKLMQVILNILKNSIEAMDFDAADKHITLNLHADDNVIELSLVDNGQGFDAKTGDHLFERGFTTKKTGTGLGLYNCKSIVESHTGSFEIRSDGPGLGAVTTIRFAI
ncbi:GHKL domain-containing protein [Mucilaginibacter sp. HMF5004]|uniref:two-component regulator propeller domain-containing protein n=1 Tax=Mucilaginibacter rivuli TaxID=2857527 RepID=UPI001C5D1FF8|nr:two-component regulator propeller domain-containing protein [Mucilaginibacter rivuli]MBW4891797.1 GHKL domain-containing protein [Mucilaginibacter rivuli]